MYNKVLTVSAVNNYIKKVFDTDFILRNSHIKGELSNVKIHSSGHIYFSLKDSTAKINCVMFKSRASSLKFRPKDGMQVVIAGNVSVYEKEGSYQLYCETMEAQGEGYLYAEFIKLKEKLEKEGVFDALRKQKLPQFPKRVGVVTAPTGAAVRDVIRVSRRRNSKVDILIYPSFVQGADASLDIAEGIRVLNSIDDIDVIILARGGGSIEDLWAFNEEPVARAIYESKKPIITGVGHETDFTIADFAADYRAATPSQAAEVAVPNLMDMFDKLEGIKEDLYSVVSDNINDKFNYINEIYSRVKLYNPESFIVNQYVKLDKYRDKLDYITSMRLKENKHKLQIIGEKIAAGNPLNILSRGYSVIKGEDGCIIGTMEKLKECERVEINMKDGSSLFKIEELE